jgi:nucleoid DNA-binding protein
MNSVELVTVLAEKLRLPKTEVSRRLDDVIEVISAQLVNNNVVSLLNFGVFEIAKRNERISVNPVNGKRMLVPPKLIVKFKASSTLKEKLKGLKP